MNAKLGLSGKIFRHGKLDSFPSLRDFVVKSSEDRIAGVLQTMKEHLENLKTGSLQALSRMG
jgi:hypothetical protein